MSKIITRALTQEQDGVPGFIASPERSAPGPAMLIIHHHYGVTGHIKHMACEFAEAGYTTMVPALYDLLGFPDYHGVQKKTTDGRFNEVIGQGWQYLLGRADVDEKRVAVMGLCMGGRIGIHFVAATPQAAAFLGYYPSVKEEGPSELQAAPSQRGRPGDSLSVPDPVRRPGPGRAGAGTGEAPGQLPRRHPRGRMALLPPGRPRLRPGRRRRLRPGADQAHLAPGDELPRPGAGDGTRNHGDTFGRLSRRVAERR